MSSGEKVTDFVGDLVLREGVTEDSLKVSMLLYWIPFLIN